ncbi:PD-(D/E)XK nuclease family protein, partial [bacterium]|nr:PD-(D/E)XK nuclease family protein [candidate division CSSED10-310 bacterium]
VDRVDCCENEAVIFDYKTGTRKITRKDIESFKSIQLGVYALAVKKILQKEPIAGCYYRVNHSGGCNIECPLGMAETHIANSLVSKASSLKSQKDWEGYFNDLAICILKSVISIRSGFFPQCDDMARCQRCDYKYLCQQLYLLENEVCQDNADTSTG